MGNVALGWFQRLVAVKETETAAQRFLAFAKELIGKAQPGEMVLGLILFDGLNHVVEVSGPGGQSLGTIVGPMNRRGRGLDTFGFFDFTDEGLLVAAAKQLVGSTSLLTVE